jgi:tRNA threonylcarbamoyladenosine biosynthesis protein TsaB
MVTLAIDASEPRGSVAILRDGILASKNIHRDLSDYSGWLLPAVDKVLLEVGLGLPNIDLIAVSTGPGSFTGLRVGLTTVKAWAEVYSKPIVGVSRLEAMTLLVDNSPKMVATAYDAQRGQLFGALFRISGSTRERIIEETVISPTGFVELVQSKADRSAVTWITLDPQLIEPHELFKSRLPRGDSLLACNLELASAIGALGEECASQGKFSDPMTLDANYVRRSDAEIFWKGSTFGAQ